MKLDWKRSFRLELEERRVLALDIGSSAVKIVQLYQYNGGYTVMAGGIAEIAASGNSSDEREINTTRAIRECLDTARVRTRLAVCGVSGPEVAVRYFKFPSLPEEEVEGAVLLEAQQVCPFNVNDGAVDYQLTSSAEKNVAGIFAAATNKLIKRKVQFAKNASLDCVLMDIEGLALLNCLSKYEAPKAGRTTAVLNVGSSFTTLAIMNDKGLPFIRDMTYAGNSIIGEIAKERDVSTEAVKKILQGESATSASDFTNSLEKACRKLIVDVTETLRYYAAQENAAIVEKIFVCGGFALVKGFAELLDKELDATVVLWNPFDKMRCDAGRLCEDTLTKAGPAMAVAAGLAMRSI